jgi:hypothetical protein
VIKVPFCADGAGPFGSGNGEAEISGILENAYGTMDWFKYLSDNANEVVLLDRSYSAAAWLTTYTFGFVLPEKKETLYRLKYGDGR